MSSPKRLLLPPALVLSLALIGSLFLHVPVYVGLGILKAFLSEKEAQVAQSRPVEIEIVPAPSERPTTAQPDETPAREREREQERPPEPQAQERRVEPPRPVVPPPETQQRPPVAQPEPRRRTSVAHRSRDPNVEPPPNAQYLAEENSRVEEETMARVRNPNLDDPEPQAATAPGREQEEGDSEEQVTAQLNERRGSNERDPTPEELRPPRERPPPPSVSRTPHANASETPSNAQRPAQNAGGGRRAEGGGERATSEIVINDGFGTLRIRVPNRPEGEGEGAAGGVAMNGSGAGQRGSGRASGRAGRASRRGPRLSLSWTQFASIYGEEELQREREAYLEQRRSRTRGASHQQRWERFRAAIENYDVHVRPGNQTALNTRADPFAAYIASMHRRIHPRFAEGFLLSLPSTVAAAYAANPNMNTKLEIGIAPDGSVALVGVAATSGDLLFDFGAYNAVMTAQPFAPTPPAIRSPDGIVYAHWSFYRNERQCGTFNSQMFILAHPPRGTAPLPRPPGLVSGDSLFRPSDEQPSHD